MRMRGFLLGGILGATAAMVFSRGNRPMLFTKINWDQAVDKAGQLVKSAKSMWDSGSGNEAAKENDTSAAQLE